MPYKIGSKLYYGSLESMLCGATYAANPATSACVPSQIKASYATSMRYGGISVDKNYCGQAMTYQTSDGLSHSAPALCYSGASSATYSEANSSLKQYITMVDNIKTNGIEPILEVPYYNGVATKEIAANLVYHVNKTMGRNVIHWTIGNEPNLGYSYTTASQIAAFIRPFAKAMKDVDPTIIINGPDLAWYDSAVMTGLTTPGGADDITGSFNGVDGKLHYYVDVLDFHTYPFNGGAAQTRAAVIAQPSSGFQNNLNALKTRVDLCNSAHGRTGASALKMAVTELNVNWQNPTGDSLTGVGATSFLGGQYWAEVMGIGMKQGLEFLNFWSVIEGLNIGYIQQDGTKLPAYYHFQMLAENFRGYYAAGTNMVSGAIDPNVKAFGSKDADQIAVMILNQKSVTALNYTVRLNTDAVSGANALKINIDAGVAMEYGNPVSEPIDPQSSVLLIFDAQGSLKKRWVYALSGNATLGLAPTLKTF